MEPICVRFARPDDLEAIVEGNLRLAEETEGKALDVAVLEKGVASLLEEPSRGFYLVAKRAGRVAGQLCITFEWSDWRNGTFFWIQSVWVRPETRNKGVYRALHQRAAELALERPDVIGLRLYVMENNHDARAVYESLAMEATPYRIYEAASFTHGPKPDAGVLTARRGGRRE